MFDLIILGNFFVRFRNISKKVKVKEKLKHNLPIYKMALKSVSGGRAV